LILNQHLKKATLFAAVAFFIPLSQMSQVLFEIVVINSKRFPLKKN
jgi:hypothetical protein